MLTRFCCGISRSTLPESFHLIIAISQTSSNCEFGKHKDDFKIVNYQSGHKGMLRTAENIDSILKKAKVLPQYRLATCPIEKNMASITLGIFCYLNDPITFRETNRTIANERWSSFCAQGNFVIEKDFETAARVTGNGSLFFTIVRHPFDRFLSGYTHICLSPQLFNEKGRCFDCKWDMRCFVNALHKFLFEQRLNNNSLASNPYLVRVLLRHFAPQNWRCDFRRHRGDYKLFDYHSDSEHVVKVAKDFDDVLTMSGVPSELRAVIQREMLAERTHHETRHSEARKYAEQRLLMDKFVMKRVIEIYLHDFIEFGYASRQEL
ncbi:hypothetical protein Q1695_010440 [Nippostrongylus brasiliensis]|nr:hypothetical protein Q1695_010440 [Nippostrongylus brasiliensis]